MANKKFWLGMLAMTLVFGLTVVGCGSPYKDDDFEPKPPEPGAYGNPIDRIETINLGTMTSPASGWRQLLSSIKSNEKYVNLDLSACTMTGTEFNPDSSIIGSGQGTGYIVSIILPTVATSIAAGTAGSTTYNSDSTFKYFNSLKSISGANIETIGDYSFCGFSYYSSYEGLEVDFPKAKTIGRSAFDSCSYLKNASFPKAETIGVDAFRSCSNLESISFPASAELGLSSDAYSNPFTGCKKIIFTLTGTGSLSVIEDGKALVRNNTILLAYPSASGNVTMNNITALDGKVFQNCSDLTDITLANVTTVGSEAFSYCSNIQAVAFPKATTISSSAFSNCDRLQSVSLPVVTKIDDAAFSSSPYIVTVTLGTTAPTLGKSLFGISGVRDITVKVPSGATGYSPFTGTAVTVSDSSFNAAVNWANGFRGGGWNGYAFISSVYIASYITLTISRQ